MDSPDHTPEPRPSWRRKTLARDAALLVLGLSLAAAMLAGFAAQRVIDASLRGGLEAELEREFQRIEASYEVWLRSEIDEIATIARDAELSRALSRAGSGDATQICLDTLLAGEPDALGLAVLRGRSREADASTSAAEWLPERWADVIAPRRSTFDAAEFLRIEDALVVAIPAAIPDDLERRVLVGAMSPASAFDTLERAARTRVAILDDRGEVVAGAASLELQEPADGFSEAREPSGASLIALQRALPNTPLRVRLALPRAGIPTGTLTSIVAASILIAGLAGLAAFAVGERRLRPLEELSEGARRLASGETGVRVPLDELHGEVKQLAISFNEMAGQLDAQRRALEQRNGELLRANEVLEQLSITDGLTHLHNHRHFHDQFAREVKRVDRSSQPLCLMLIDVDDFKVLNDTWGHAVGDMVLAAAAQLMHAQIRETDYLARYGGEEFVILARSTGKTEAVRLADYHTRQGYVIGRKDDGQQPFAKLDKRLLHIAARRIEIAGCSFELCKDMIDDRSEQLLLAREVAVDGRL